MDLDASLVDSNSDNDLLEESSSQLDDSLASEVFLDDGNSLGDLLDSSEN